MPKLVNWIREVRHDYNDTTPHFKLIKGLQLLGLPYNSRLFSSILNHRGLRILNTLVKIEIRKMQ